MIDKILPPAPRSYPSIITDLSIKPSILDVYAIYNICANTP